MAQRPKEDVRRAIVDAAVAELASVGFEGTTLAGVAARAGTSVGNVYRYFASKEELFAAAIPDELAREVAGLVRARIEALGAERDPAVLGAEHRYQAIVRELVALTSAHRERLLFLLSRAHGTAHATYFDDRVEDLTRSALAYAERAYPTFRPSAADRRVLRRAYHAFLVGLVVTLREETRPTALERAIARLTTYHLAGLRALFQELASEKPKEPR